MPKEIKKYECIHCGNVEETEEDCLACEDKHTQGLRVKSFSFERRASTPREAILEDNKGNEYKYKLVCLSKRAEEEE